MKCGNHKTDQGTIKLTFILKLIFPYYYLATIFL